MTQPAARPEPSLRHAVAYSFAQKYLAFFVHVAMTVVLARLLTPEETGIFSLAIAAVGLGHLLRDFGTADYVISQKEVSQDKLRAAFTVTVLMAWGIALVLLLLAQPMATAYKEPGVARVLQLLCLNFVLLPFGTVAFAMLSKEMRFGRIFAAQTSANLLSAGVTVWAAWAGYSYMSLAMGSVAANLWTIALLLLLQPRTVFMKPTLRGLGSVLRFGGALTAARLIEQGANRSADFIVSGMLGFHAGGLMSKTGSLLNSFHEFFSSAVVRVATPAFAKSSATPLAERQGYLQGTVLVGTALWLFFPFLALYAHEIILLMFGANWLECVPFVKVGAVGSMCWAPFMLSSSLLTARSAVAAQMRIQLVMAPVTVAALVGGALIDLYTLVVVLTAAQLVRFYMINRAVDATCGIGFKEVMRALAPSAVLAVLALAGGALAKWAAVSAGLPTFLVIACGAAATALAAALAAWQLRHPAYAEVARLLQPWLARRAARRTAH